MVISSVLGTILLFVVSLLPLPAGAQAAIEEEPIRFVFWLLETGGAFEAGQLDITDGEPVGSVAVADFDMDGSDELVLGTAYGSAPVVRVARTDGSLTTSFSAYDEGVDWGIEVAAGDFEGDGRMEIVTAAGPGTNGHVRVLGEDGEARFLVNGFFPFSSDNRHGLFVAICDIDGDGIKELVTTSGPGSEPRLALWGLDGRGYMGEFAPFDEDRTEGVRIACGDIDGDGRDELVVAPAYGGPPTVRVFDGRAFVRLVEFNAFDEGFSGGLNLDVFDIDGNGREEIIVAPAFSGPPEVRIFRAAGEMLSSFMAFDPDHEGGIIARGGRFGEGGLRLIAIMPSGNEDLVRPYLPQHVSIDISEQRLRAYEYGRFVNSFLVSTGQVKFPTPIGEFSALAKPLYVHYTWVYGKDHPENYDLGVIPYNIRFFPHIYIHYAPWHNNFGQRMSHGCVNAPLWAAKWIYNWISVGTPINIHW
ncbi:MAG: FG-GAP-like repeat-containing protein [Patescibacteria group bacterium]|nr:FG-GAP-like repeat-containing protein [Patescibacteria group bacterium]